MSAVTTYGVVALTFMMLMYALESRGRRLVLLFASLNQPADVIKIDRLTGKILAEVHTGSDCRSLAISTDGTALNVVNYISNTVTELASSNLRILQVVPTGTNPVGVTYDGATGRVWVAVYTGEILVFNTK